MEFGSSEALDEWIRGQEPTEDESVEIDIYSIPWRSIDAPRRGVKYIRYRSDDTPVRCSCCIKCKPAECGTDSGVGDQIYFTIWKSVHITTSDSEDEKPDIEESTEAPSPPSLSLEEPHRSPPTRHCQECSNPLLTTRAILQPPVFCEYSGRLISSSISQMISYTKKLARSISGTSEVPPGSAEKTFRTSRE